MLSLDETIDEDILNVYYRVSHNLLD